jgi:hypothetical protein
MQAVQNIACINGRPAIWGDAVLGLVRASNALELFDETFEGTYPDDDFAAVCTAKRKGDSKPVIRSFSIGDAKQAGLWCQGTKNEKTQLTPWYKYPKRMLQMRARSWALRDGFGDVLKGLRTAEEVMDYDLEMERGQDGTYSAPPAKAEPAPRPETSLKERLHSVQSVVREIVEEAQSEPEDRTGFGKQYWRLFRPKYIELPPAKFVQFVEANLDNFEAMKMEYPLFYNEARTIWQERFEDPWPLDPDEDPEEIPSNEVEKQEVAPGSKKEPAPGTDKWADFRALYINRRTAGYSTFVHYNKHMFQEMRPIEPAMYEEAVAKWISFYPDDPWPCDNDSYQGKPKAEEPPKQLHPYHAGRFAAGGDIHDAYSADFFPKIRKPFEDGGWSYTVTTLGPSGKDQPPTTAEAWRLEQASEWPEALISIDEIHAAWNSGKRARGDYTGMLVNYGHVRCVMADGWALKVNEQPEPIEFKKPSQKAVLSEARLIEQIESGVDQAEIMEEFGIEGSTALKTAYANALMNRDKADQKPEREPGDEDDDEPTDNRKEQERQRTIALIKGFPEVTIRRAQMHLKMAVGKHTMPSSLEGCIALHNKIIAVYNPDKDNDGF